MDQPEPYYAQLPQQARNPLARRPIHVVLDNLRSAFNVGSIFRTADAGAVEHIHLCGMTAHPPHKKLEKTALGAFDYVPWTYHPRTKDAIRELQARNIPCVAVEVTADATPLPAMYWTQPVAIVFGNEVSGITGDILKRCDHTVQIPMHGYKNTINVATAFGIVLYDILHRTGTDPHHDKNAAQHIRQP